MSFSSLIIQILVLVWRGTFLDGWELSGHGFLIESIIVDILLISFDPSRVPNIAGVECAVDTAGVDAPSVRDSASSRKVRVFERRPILRAAHRLINRASRPRRISIVRDIVLGEHVDLCHLR